MFRIFISYSHEDQDLLKRLRQHLGSLEHNGFISTFDDLEIRAGAEWDKEIRNQLVAADLILLLISPGFLGSAYVHSVELRQAIERHNSRKSIVIPIALKPCHWGGAPFERLQGLPRSRKPVVEWPNIDVAFQNIVQNVHDRLSELAEEKGDATPDVRLSGTIGLSKESATDEIPAENQRTEGEKDLTVSDASDGEGPPIRRKNFRKIELLADLDIFRLFRRDEIEKIAKLATWQACEPNKVLFRKGNAGGSLMLVCSGLVRVYRFSEKGQEVILNLFRPGEVFGEISLLDGSNRTAHARTTAKTELLVLKRSDFTTFLKGAPDAALRLIETLSYRLRRTTQYLEDLAFKEGTSRLASRLIHLAETEGIPTADGVRIDKRLSQQQIGNMVGLSRTTVSKYLKAWQDQGFISSTSGYYTIKELGVLKNISQKSARAIR